mgnify:CR=1 FL=1
MYQAPELTSSPPAKGRTARYYLGMFLFILSWILFGGMFVMPWFDLPAEIIASGVGGLFIGAEVTFWASVLLLGKPLVDAIRARCGQWLRIKKAKSQA